jgi:hypothetical protein
MLDVPLILPTAIVALLAIFEWNRSVVLARVALGAAFAMLLAAVRDPGFSATEILMYYEDGLTYLMAVARVVGLGCFILAAHKLLRGLMLPRDMD